MSTARIWSLLRLEAQLQWRYRIVALVAALTVGWAVVLALVPTAVATALVGWVLMLETAVLATTVAGALVLMERDQGIRAALATSPARLRERLLARVGLLTGLVVASAALMAIAAGPRSVPGLAAALTGVGLTAVLTTVLAIAVAVHRESVISFMVMLPLVLLPLVLAAVLQGAGLRHPLLYAVPTTGAMDLITAGFREPAPGLAWSASAVWLVVAAAGAAWLAGHQFRRSAAARTATMAYRPVERPALPARATRPVRGDPVWSFLRTDLVNLRRDPLLILIGLSPLLLGLGLRFGYAPAHEWLLTAYGFDVAPYRTVLFALAVVLHVPVSFGMMGALMVLDDADSRALTALRASPLTLPRYLAMRSGLVTVATVVGLAVAVPLSGLATMDSSLAGLAPAVLVAPLIMFVTLAVAGNKVEGVAVLKVLGLPLYLPVAVWWLDGVAGWLLAPLPTWWVLRALWTSWPYAVGAVLVIGCAVAALGYLAQRRLGPPRTSRAAASRPLARRGGAASQRG